MSSFAGAGAGAGAGGGQLTNQKTNLSLDFLKSMGFTALPRGFWVKNRELQPHNILSFIKWFEEINGIRDKKAWYKIRGEQINSAGGRGFFTNSKCNNPLRESIYALMMLVYPEVEWVPWEFTQAPQGFWKVKENRLRWCEAFRKKHSILTLDKFYDYILSDFEEFPGRCVSYYGDSIIDMLKDLYTHYPWREWRFAGQVPQNFWKDVRGIPNIDNIKRWFEQEIIETLGWTSYDDMYQLTQPIIASNYGGGLSTHVINGSPILLLSLLYPDYNWQFWKFISAPNNAWDNIENQRKYLLWTCDDDKDKIQERMYSYSLNNLSRGLVVKYTSLYLMATTCFPEIGWEESKFRGLKTERRLYTFLTKIFPSITKQYTPIWLRNEYTGYYRRLDFYIPELMIVIELDGPQHFKQVWNWLDPKEQARSDVWKMKQANDNGISIIRLLQADVFDCTDEWLMMNLVPELVPQTEVTNYIIASEDKMFLYDYHESLLLTSS